MKKNIAHEILRGGKRCAYAVVIASAFASALVGSALAAPTEVPLKSGFSTDFTDTWWNPTQSGWGLQMMQTGSFIFTTIYVYDQGGRATWFGGGLNSNGGTTFAGKLYVTTGPYYGGPFNPQGVTVREAGTMTFDAQTADSGQFTYTVDGVAVTKFIQRQPLTQDNYTGAYAAVLTQTKTLCIDTTKNGPDTQSIGAQISQSGGGLQLDTVNPAGDSCNITGAYSQLGRSGRVEGIYTCLSGDSGSATLSEMNNHVRQFSARIKLQSSDLGCVTNAYITGIVPD